jgi:hypothetical protein
VTERPELNTRCGLTASIREIIDGMKRSAG